MVINPQTRLALFSVTMIALVTGGKQQRGSPPNDLPTLLVNDTPVAHTGLHWVKLNGDSPWLQTTLGCLARGDPRSVRWTQIQCGQSTSTRVPGATASLQINLLAPSDFTCTCMVKYRRRAGRHEVTSLLFTEATLLMAHGPYSVDIRIDNNDLPLNICPDDDRPVLNVVCKVKKTEVHPPPTFTLTSSPPTAFREIASTLDGSVDDHYVQMFRLLVWEPGLHKLTCNVANSLYKEMVVEKSAAVSVQSPPQTPPIITAHTSWPGDSIVESEDVTLNCTATGGFPNVHAVTISCGPFTTSTSSGCTSSLEFRSIDYHYHGAKCICRGEHATGCYRAESSYEMKLVVNPYRDLFVDLPLEDSERHGILRALVLVGLVLLVILCVLLTCGTRRLSKRFYISRQKLWNPLRRKNEKTAYL